MSRAILIIEDEATLAKNMALYLTRHGYTVNSAGSAEEGLEQIDAFRPAVVLLDFNLPGINGLELMAEIRRRDSQIILIMVTGHGSEQVAVDAMKAGAYDYLTKPLILSKLKIILDKAVGQQRLEDEIAYYRKQAASGSGIAKLLGESPPMLALKGVIRQILAVESRLADAEPPTVLITGETGSGKEVVARALHFDGSRRNRPFVEINCSALPPNLLEAELFGYERGAFTDAKERKLGLIETAEGGTLFLDEIGDIDLALQVKLLKLLENKMVRRIGNVRENKANVRIVTATNKCLEQLVNEGKFRSDLFFRLRIIHVELPPLRERGEDIVLLAQHFLDMHATRYGKRQMRFSAEALALMRSYAWPGNVRELRNVLEQSVIMAHIDTVGAEHLSLSGHLDARNRVSFTDNNKIEAVVQPHDGISLGEVEKDLVVQALEKTAWNVTRAAMQLGISRDALRYRMAKFNLSRPS